MSPVTLFHREPLRKSKAFVQLVGGSGAFIVSYQKCDRPTLESITTYQRAIRHDYPGWVSRFAFDRSRQTCELHVFPLSDAPSELLAQGTSRWRQMK
jgi:hypothetical protein